MKEAVKKIMEEEPNPHGPKAFWKVGAIEEALRGAAAAVPVVLDQKLARLDLAEDVFGRSIGSYKDLSPDELHALYRFTQSQGPKVKEWIQERYGQQLTLF